MRRHRLVMLAMTVSILCSHATAQDGDGDAAFDTSLKQFGYNGGAAWQCAEEQDKNALADDARRVFNRVAQLFGTDRAFFFSAAFDAGTTADIASGDCAAHEDAFAEGLAAHRLGSATE